METGNSQKLFEEALSHIAGGVNSPVRAFKSVGGAPLFITRAKGSKVWDADGNEYIDYVGSWGPAILGHAPPKILTALHDAMKEGLSFGAPTAKEIILAKLVKEAFPSIDLLRFVNSGTEATMSALRLARAFTKRSKIIKFDGCYHGHADYLLVKTGSGAATLGIPDSAGVPPEFVANTLVARFNDLLSVKKIFSENKNQIAAVILEPVVGNMGCIPPAEGFLKNLRELTANEGALLIFDEVMTGFRVAFGGAQELYGLAGNRGEVILSSAGTSSIDRKGPAGHEPSRISDWSGFSCPADPLAVPDASGKADSKITSPLFLFPDLTCLGKIIGGGLPVGAYGGRREIIEMVAPLGPVYQAGTLSGNPLAMAAGIATLTELKNRKNYDLLEEKGKFLEEEMTQIARAKKIPFQFNRVGSLFSFFFSKEPVIDADSARKADSNFFKKFFHAMLKEGIYLAPSPFEAGFISLAHSSEDLEATLQAFTQALS